METVAPQLTPNPLLGTVTDAAGRPVADATVSIMNGKSTVATTTTDATGFYYVARTGRTGGGAIYLLAANAHDVELAGRPVLAPSAYLPLLKSP